MSYWKAAIDTASATSYTTLQISDDIIHYSRNLPLIRSYSEYTLFPIFNSCKLYLVDHQHCSIYNKIYSHQLSWILFSIPMNITSYLCKPCIIRDRNPLCPENKVFCNHLRLTRRDSLVQWLRSPFLYITSQQRRYELESIKEFPT
jgi:hypothetical protein